MKRRVTFGSVMAAAVLATGALGVAWAAHSADLTGDGRVDQADLNILISQWRLTGTRTADLDHNSLVDSRDAGRLFSWWGTLPTPPPPSGTRDPARWPFAADSPWNYPIGSGATYATIAGALTGSPFTGGAMSNQNWTRAIWVATPTDPIRRIYRSDRNMAFFERRIPDAAAPPGGTDAHMTIIDPTHRLGFEMYGAFQRSDGDWQCRGAAVDVDLFGPGINFNRTPAYDGYTSAYGGSQQGGLIRGPELTTSAGIKHALGFIGGNPNWNRIAPAGRRYVWPASAQDLDGSSYGTTGNLYLGSLVALPPSVNINALGLETVEALRIAQALQDYGAYGIGSGNLGTNITLQYNAAERNLLPASNNSWWAAFQRDLNRMIPQLQLVTNSHNNGAAPAVPGGGGIPRRPFAPPFDR